MRSLDDQKTEGVPPEPPALTRPVELHGNFGPYWIRELLGEGGMGCVYEAEDKRLGRTVALKVLPPELTREPVAKARFLQEARAASALDHPNLCTIYEVGETEEKRLYLAMPRYDGETLRSRLEQDERLPVPEALDLAAQALKGLAKAHRHGIVHRDIKPANLIVTSDGVLKILDFGIAKLAGAADLTRTGIAIGTPAYMSPEQARGEAVDARTDLWAVGVLLYEMLTGVRPFQGDNERALQYGIQEREPEPVRHLRPDAPPEVEGILARLLAKSPGARYASAEAALDDLRALLGTTSRSLTVTTDAVPVSRRALRLLVGGAVALAIGSAAVGYWLTREMPGGAAAPPSSTRLTDQEGRELFPSLSPDGVFFAYAGVVQGNSDIYLQRTGGGNPIHLTPDTPWEDTQPAFSPDGQQIAFRSERDGGGIFLMGATGESVRRLTDFGYNPSWSPDGRQIAVGTEGVADPSGRMSISQIWTVDVATGERREVVREDAVQPSWSPSGRRIAYWGVPVRGGRRTISTAAVTGEKAGGEPVRVTDDGSLNWNPVWSPDGRHLYFASDRSGSMNLWRVPIDESSGRVLGEPEPISTPSPWSAMLSLSRDGRRILYTSDTSEANIEKVAFDPERGQAVGPPAAVTRGARIVRSVSVSPDGSWIAFTSLTPREDVFAVRGDGGGLRQLTDDPHKDRLARWSPDGRQIAFYSNRNGRYEIWTIRPDGSDLRPATRTKGPSLTTPIWSPDGRRMLYGTSELGSGEIDLTRPLEQRRPRPLPRIGRDVFLASSWSADGRWLAGSRQPPHRPPAPGIFLHSLASGQYRRLTSWGESAQWMPGGRALLVWDRQRLARVDAGSGEARDVGLNVSSLNGPLAVNLSADGRTLYLIRTIEKSDVWMLAF